MKKPECFGQFPEHHPHIQAERCCDDCQCLMSCQAKTGVRWARELGKQLLKELENEHGPHS